MPITLEATFDKFPELLSKRFLVKQMVYSKPRPRGFAGVGRAYALLRRADAKQSAVERGRY